MTLWMEKGTLFLRGGKRPGKEESRTGGGGGAEEVAARREWAHCFASEDAARKDLNR